MEQVNGSQATNGPDDKRVRSEPRVLGRYGERDDEHTKPSVMLLDWIGEDEVTVKWETVRRDVPAAVPAAEGGAPLPFAYFDDEDEDLAPRRFRGIGGRAGGVILGVVLGAALTIGIFAVFVPEVPAPNSGVEVPASHGTSVPPSESEQRPAVMPASGLESSAVATAPR